MQVRLPPDIITRLEQIAAETDQSIEDVLYSRLKPALEIPTLPPDEEAELAALEHLSDDALWTIAREKLPAGVQSRMQVLMDKNSLGQISDPEYDELAAFVERGQRLTVRKARAMALLTARGHRITWNDL
jgi:hypothetical protein